MAEPDDDTIAEPQGFHVRRFGPGDVHLVRFWRNSNHVRGSMVDQSLISHSRQELWFHNRQPENEHRFVYGLGAIDIGSMHIEPTDDNSFEAGLMCGDRDFLGHWVNLAAVLYLYDFAFLAEQKSYATARILRDNRQSLRLNTSLGFVETGNTDGDSLSLRLNREDYLERRHRFTKFLYFDVLGRI